MYPFVKKSKKEKKLAKTTNEVVEANSDQDAPQELSKDKSTVKENIPESPNSDEENSKK